MEISRYISAFVDRPTGSWAFPPSIVVCSAMSRIVLALSALLAAIGVDLAMGFLRLGPVTQRVYRQAGSMSMNDVEGLHAQLYEKVNAALNLKEAGGGIKRETFNAWTAASTWYDEQKGSKLTGVAVGVIKSETECLCTLNGWMGPKYFVPHMLLTVSKQANAKYSVVADFVPRGPTAFGSDDSYLGTYYGQDVMAWHENAYAADGAMPLPPSKSFAARLLRSPAQVAVGELSFDDVAEIATKHVTRWLEWVAEGKESEARQRGALNGRDDKLRMFAFRAAVSENAERFGGEVGKSVGAGITGPVAEAYVGGGG